MPWIIFIILVSHFFSFFLGRQQLHRQRRNVERYRPPSPGPSKPRREHNSSTEDELSSREGQGKDDEQYFKHRQQRSMDLARARINPTNSVSISKLLLAGDQQRIAGTNDIEPMAMDTSIRFSNVGGLDHHVRALREMIVFPMMYPEVFTHFKIDPPRGVLFHGPPGTGKTLVARALANECSRAGRQVSFFMRKGADCLSKWVGESERMLRLLFDQAYKMRPSIIFFDEIDGLAPIRSSRQDQNYSSIVSTLLALMDGLDARGEVVIIGATNRIDHIDPALRRPGRFDREFLFQLPSAAARQQILGIQTASWEPRPSDEFLHILAMKTVGYCGADLRSLCAEAALQTLRRMFPQVFAHVYRFMHLSTFSFLLSPSKIYETDDRLIIDTAALVVNACDFFSAILTITPVQLDIPLNSYIIHETEVYTSL